MTPLPGTAGFKPALLRFEPVENRRSQDVRPGSGTSPHQERRPRQHLAEVRRIPTALGLIVAVAKPHHPAFFHKIVCLVGEKISVYL